ncbi:hypothetical protein C8R47DRAFT_1144544 [Mycena vitilis]|nr:hypothetical protein C8R47DRAFT_1144544 [Mycena vitilis]
MFSKLSVNVIAAVLLASVGAATAASVTVCCDATFHVDDVSVQAVAESIGLDLSTLDPSTTFGLACIPAGQDCGKNHKFTCDTVPEAPSSVIVINCSIV